MRCETIDKLRAQRRNVCFCRGAVPRVSLRSLLFLREQTTEETFVTGNRNAKKHGETSAKNGQFFRETCNIDRKFLAVSV